jgi:imidazolonepropionase-like amidohydrolase
MKVQRFAQQCVAAMICCGMSLPMLQAQEKATKANQSEGLNVVAITGGKLLTVTHGVIENGVLVLSDGKITAIGTAKSIQVPKGATVVDAKGRTVYPGLFDAETNLGLIEIGSNVLTSDLVEDSDEIMPHMHVYDAFHAETTHIPIARVNGVTMAIVAPGSKDLIAGQDSLIQLDGKDRDEMIVSKDIALAVNFGAEQRRAALGAGVPKYPSTRMGLISQLRQTLLDAQDYKNKKNAAGQKEGAAFKVDLKYEALIPYLSGERPVVIGVREAYELEPIMAVAEEFHLKVILNHVTHMDDVLDKIASYHVPVIFSSIWELPEVGERYDAVYAMPGRLANLGVKVAIATDSYEKDRNLPYAAGYAVAYGMPYEEALKAITLNPAEMFGMGDRYGSLDVGKVANVVVANGDPLDVRTSVEKVYIRGKLIDMSTRQTELRDAYSK